jgi:hypothetical protein
MKLNCGTIQDLYHYSLAMIGETNGMDASGLRSRLDCAESAYGMVANIDGEFEAAFFQNESALRSDYESEKDLILAGCQLRDRVSEWAALHGIDPNKGEANKIKCVVCGQPAMTKATRCYLHTFGHEFGGK